MGFMDELKDKAEEFGDKAVEGFGSAKDKTEEVIENVKDRFDGTTTPRPWRTSQLVTRAKEPTGSKRRWRSDGVCGVRSRRGYRCSRGCRRPHARL